MVFDWSVVLDRNGRSKGSWNTTWMGSGFKRIGKKTKFQISEAKLSVNILYIYLRYFKLEFELDEIFSSFKRNFYGNFCKVMLQSLPKLLVTVIEFFCLTNEVIWPQNDMIIWYAELFLHFHLFLLMIFWRKDAYMVSPLTIFCSFIL